MTSKEHKILIGASLALIVLGIYINSKKKPTSTLGTSFANPKSTVNKDGSPKKQIINNDGVPSNIVDAAGDYIEISDNSTLYDANGNVRGNINPAYGMFVDSQGNIIAASDGTPVVFNISNNTYTEPDGTVYNIDGSVNTPSTNSKNWWDSFKGSLKNIF